MGGTISESRSGHRGGIAAGDRGKQSASTVENRSSHEGTSGTFKRTFCGILSGIHQIAALCPKAALSAP
jgi:hypothetical protein